MGHFFFFKHGSKPTKAKLEQNKRKVSSGVLLINRVIFQTARVQETACSVRNVQKCTHAFHLYTGKCLG